ncbi:MAG TPA: regulatory protein RecX [Bacteroidia bacterium]|nr:regulatory protein RecX [Bacteroidia bacterium]
MKRVIQKEPVKAAEALTRIQQFCAFRERSEREVTIKLSNWGLTKEESVQIIQRLREAGFLNENRFAGSFAGGKFRTRKWGKVKIKAMLSGSMVSEEAISNALKQIPDKEYQQELEQLMIKKLAVLNESDPTKRIGKLVRYATGKGYEPDLVWKLAGKLLQR